MKIAIIEPHYDDCWLNMGGLMLKNPYHKYKIITISKDDKWGNNENNTKKLSNFFPNFRSIDFRYDSLDVNIESVKKQLKKKGIKNLEELFFSLNKTKGNSEILEKIDKEIRHYDIVFFPLGINHPMHKVVGNWTVDKPIIKYLEYPYAFYKEKKENLQKLTKNMCKFEYDISSVVLEKEKIFREVYTSEIFILNLPECSVRLKDLKKEVFYSNSKEAGEIWQMLV